MSPTGFPASFAARVQLGDLGFSNWRHQQNTNLGARDAEKLGLQGFPTRTGRGQLYAPFGTSGSVVSATQVVSMPVLKSCHVLTRQVCNLGMCF